MPYDEKTLKRDGSGITPVPQHFNPVADDYEAILGRNGASRVELYGADGNPTSTDFATQTTLAAILAKIITAPSTEAKQDALNALIGEVQASPTANTLLARIKSLEDKLAAIIAGTSPASVQLLGSKVEIGGVTFEVSGGDTLRGKSADKPDEVAAHAVIPYCFYFSIDTGTVEATDGTNWVVI